MIVEHPTIKINEIFLSIPEEGPQAKNPTIFIRVSSGSLHILDGEHSNDTWKGTIFSVDEVLDQIRHNPTQFVRIVGEDPLSQKGTYTLVEKLLHRKYLISMELKLEHLNKDIPSGVSQVVEIPASQLSLLREFKSKMSNGDTLRFVVSSASEIRSVQEFCLEESLLDKYEIIFSGASGISPETLGAWILNAEGENVVERGS